MIINSEDPLNDPKVKAFIEKYKDADSFEIRPLVVAPFR